MKNPIEWLKSLVFIAIFSGLTACGGTSDEAVDVPIAENAKTSCETSDEDDDDANCGKLLLGITDADGDFLNYQVEVTGLELTRADGTQVSVLTTNQMVNFVDYVELTELAAAATIPAGIYVSGQIEIDYSNADIQVEKDGVAAVALMVDENGDAVATETLALQFDQTNRLVVARHRPAMLEIDFNLTASHQVDLQADPVTVTTEPYIVAEVDPVESKEFRVRGPLLRVNEANSLFRIAVRPFHRRDARFGGVNVFVDDQTNFEIDGVTLIGEQGLSTMAELTPETPTLTLGEFNRAENRFTAITVLAGSSVPGAELDAVRGVIVARDNNTLSVKGASLIRTDGEVNFDDEISILLSDDTQVFKKRRMQQPLSIEHLSIGQAVTVLGSLSEQSGELVMDATQGLVRMRLTAASGHHVTSDGATLALELQALQGRKTDSYDFTGTGMDENFDADPSHYEVDISNLLTSDIADNAPVRVTGFISPFGTAPADFNAVSVIDYSESRSQLLLNWPNDTEETTIKEITDTSLIMNPLVVGGHYKLIQGGIRTELASLGSEVALTSTYARGLFTIKSESGITAFSNFAEFLNSLQQRVEQGEQVDLIHATGGFDATLLQLDAIKVAVKLI